MSKHSYDYTPPQKNNAFIAERNLLAKIIDRALVDVVESKELSNNAYSWFVSKNEEPHSFLWICNWLDYDSKVFIRRVETLKKRRGMVERLTYKEKRNILLEFDVYI